MRKDIRQPLSERWTPFPSPRVEVLAGRVRGSGRAADLPGVRRAQAEDGGDSGPHGRPAALPHHLLHLSGSAAAAGAVGSPSGSSSL